MLKCDICGVEDFDLGLIDGKYYCPDCFILTFVRPKYGENTIIEVNKDEKS
jgi:uncharacterized Zn finger protein (UPF0148 family)